MKRLNQYFVMQLLAPFGFFSLVMIGILWLATALPLVDKVVESGQSGFVFLEVTSLLIPRVMMVAIPFAAFGAALFALNRLYSEAELVVMMTAGQSPMALAKPIAIFGTMIMALMFLTTYYLVPASQTRLNTRMHEIRTEMAGSLIREGQFIHPTSNITIYVRDTSRDGEMAGLFLHDQNEPDVETTYSAQKALFLQDGVNMRIVMIDGIIQRYSKNEMLLNTIQFDRFSFDLGNVFPDTKSYSRSPFEMFPHELLFPSEQMQASTRYDRGQFLAEGHHKIAAPLFALVLPLVALGAIVLGGFRRGGFSTRVFYTFALGLVLHSSMVVAKSMVQRFPDFAWTIYVPAFVGAGLAFYFLYLTGRTRRKKRFVKKQ